MEEHDEEDGQHDYSFDVGDHLESLGFGFLFFRYVWPVLGALLIAFILGLILVAVVNGG